MTRWPSWAESWYGLVIRVILGSVGLFAGAGMLWIASFGASFKNDSPVWGGEEISVLIVGLVVLVATAAATFKPSKATWGGYLLGLIAIPVLAALI